MGRILFGSCTSGMMMYFNGCTRQGTDCSKFDPVDQIVHPPVIHAGEAGVVFFDLNGKLQVFFII